MMSGSSWMSNIRVISSIDNKQWEVNTWDTMQYKPNNNNNISNIKYNAQLI